MKIVIVGRALGALVAGLSLAGGALLVAGCGHAPRRAADTKPSIALRRGASWAALSVDRPHINGPTGQLELKDGELSGLMGSRAMRVKIAGDRAEGYGPSGPVQLSVSRQDGGATTVEGTWNGGPVHLTLGPGGLRASVIRRGSRFATTQASCAYTLDRVDPSGAAVSGSSICSGMPEETRLEIDPRARAALSPTELSVLLVALLATPPDAGPAEAIGGL